MSYDLLFMRKQRHSIMKWPLLKMLSGREANQRTFAEYFSRRRFYKVTKTQALYENEDSGVQFIFNIADQDEIHCASFQMNYLLPHTFALEAEPEVTAFIKYFGLSIDDPQAEGMGHGPYSPEGFIKAWNISNDMVTKSMSPLLDVNPGPFNAPKSVIERVWRWNFARASLQQASHVVFYPKMIFMRKDDKISIVVTWNGKPSIFPPVDYVLLAPDPVPGTKREYALRTYDEVVARLIGYEAEKIAGLDCLQPAVDAHPDANMHWVFAQSSESLPISLLSADKVLAGDPEPEMALS